MDILYKFKDKLRTLSYLYSILVLVHSYYRRLSRRLLSKRLIYKAGNYHKKALVKIKGKQTFRVLFFVIDTSSWKYDEVFTMMKNHSRFHPTIVISPMVNWGIRTMREKMTQCMKYFESKGYETISSLDLSTGKYIDINKTCKPDIIFYTNPYEGLIDDRFYIKNFIHTLTVYVPYAFNNNSDHNFAQNELLHNLVWRYYAETERHKLYSKNYADNRGVNVVVSGYPSIERFIDKEYKPSTFPWKSKNMSLKRIIWAPHHTIEGTGCVNYSCFLQYADFMLKLASEYKDQVQFVFKPHPLLKTKLMNLWGEEKALTYFSEWASKENTDINEGEYIDLFLTSDAMIHDSGSFITEYLYVNKPVLRTMNDIPIEKMYDDLAQQSLEHYYKAYGTQDIVDFIDNVINNCDELYKQRTDYIKKELMPSAKPSQIIIDDIINSIDNQILYH